MLSASALPPVRIRRAPLSGCGNTCEFVCEQPQFGVVAALQSSEGVGEGNLNGSKASCLLKWGRQERKRSRWGTKRPKTEDNDAGNVEPPAFG